MIGVILFVLSFLASSTTAVITPTEGSPWPRPQAVLPSSGNVLINANTFQFYSSNFDCDILQNAYSRYMNIIFGSNEALKKKSRNLDFDDTPLFNMSVALHAECEDIPYLNMDEQYVLDICSPNAPDEVSLITNTVWGALRGLETFSQLLTETSDPDVLSINCTQIIDFPRFSHRGILLDTSRHYLPTQILKDNLDLMAMNKLNVFHWHMVDDQSFPYVSDVYPDLSQEGAWSDIHIYTAADVAEIVEYARQRGIRVIAEFDTPGHTLSWGPGQPGLLTECYSDGIPDGTLGPVDPSKAENYDFMKELLTEIGQRFPDHYLHLGGDEVASECWESNPNVTEFMARMNITDSLGLEEYYIKRLMNITSNLPTQNGYIVWQEVFDNGEDINKDAIIHVWKYRTDPLFYYIEMHNVTAAGYPALFSACWYLNDISYGVDWHKYYECDPHGFQGTAEQNELVLGGEACMWGEYVDKTNVISRTWPRASPVAEKLWSAQEATTDVNDAAPRLEEHRCRLLRRGFPVQPLGPSFCNGIL